MKTTLGIATGLMLISFGMLVAFFGLTTAACVMGIIFTVVIGTVSMICTAYWMGPWGVYFSYIINANTLEAMFKIIGALVQAIAESQ